MTPRTLADRLADLRADRARSADVSVRPSDDRAASLARWFGASLSYTGRGAAVLVERSLPLGREVSQALAAVAPATYFDTETTGLSTGAGTMVFLAGLGHVEGERLVVRQLLLPDYPHETALLRQVTAELGTRTRLVTYNGRGFDMPLLGTRLTLNGLFGELAALPQIHDDLLPVARRLFRRPLGGARLADIEAGVLGVRRSSDCPSSEVPARYFGYLRSGTPELLAAVLDHNLQDICSLALLEAAVLQLLEGGWRTAEVLDRHGMAVELLRHGAPDEALELVDAAPAFALDPAEAMSLRRLATRLLLAAGEVDRAEALWTAGTQRASVDAAAAWIEVARIRERHRGDLAGALDAVHAAARVLDLAFALGRGGGIRALGAVRLRVDSRLRRLRRWVAAAERRAERERRIA